jgi:hypothetical protein
VAQQSDAGWKQRLHDPSNSWPCWLCRQLAARCSNPAAQQVFTQGVDSEQLCMRQLSRAAVAGPQGNG